MVGTGICGIAAAALLWIKSKTNWTLPGTYFGELTRASYFAADPLSGWLYCGPLFTLLASSSTSLLISSAQQLIHWLVLLDYHVKKWRQMASTMSQCTLAYLSELLRHGNTPKDPSQVWNEPRFMPHKLCNSLCLRVVSTESILSTLRRSDWQQ